MQGENVLIAGCGALGQALAPHLAGAGARVYGLRRSAHPLPEPIQTVQADLLAPETLLAAVPEPIHRVFFILTPDSYDHAGYEAAFVRAQGHLIDHLATRGDPVKRWTFVSSTSVYGQSDGEWVDETSPTVPPRETGRALLAGERRALEAPWAGCVVRFGGIYGAGRDMLIRKAQRGDPCRTDHYTNRIHQTDAVRILAHLGDDHVDPGTYLGVDDEPATQCAVLDEIARLMGRPRPPRGTDADAPVRAGSKRCSNARLRATGFTCRYPTFREGYAAELPAGDPGPGA